MLDICKHFCLKGNAVDCLLHGNGHINTTYLVKSDAGINYILQKLNHNVFHDIPALMANVKAITSHLSMKDPDPRHSLHLIPTHSGDCFYLTQNGDFYRMYDFITDGLCLDAPETDGDLFQSGIAFGIFQKQLIDFPAECLNETIPGFHNTPIRYKNLHMAIDTDPFMRAARCKQEIAFALAHEHEATHLTDLCHCGNLPVRVTHNDTKLNNVMLDAATRKALCIIDLDTVMPGLVANDFGDAIRFGASTGAEDERDLRKISLSLGRYKAFSDGFLSACGDMLTPLEINTLPWGAKLMTLECGIRFLSDYLMGDIYFRIHRKEHNLDRARTQFKLVNDMESKWEEMAAIIELQ